MGGQGRDQRQNRGRREGEAGGEVWVNEAVGTPPPRKIGEDRQEATNHREVTGPASQ